MSMATATYQLVPGIPEFHQVTSAAVQTRSGQVTIRARRADGAFVELVFETTQATRITTGDCFLRPAPESGYRSWRLLEISASPWIAELQVALSETSSVATFLDEAHHYLLDGSDDVVEVVAWGVTWKPAEPA